MLRADLWRTGALLEGAVAGCERVQAVTDGVWLGKQGFIGEADSNVLTMMAAANVPTGSKDAVAGDALARAGDCREFGALEGRDG